MERKRNKLKKQKNPERMNKLDEPDLTYTGSKKISFSDSFDAAEDKQIRYWAGQSPEQRFSGFYELMNRFYKFDKPDWRSKKIIIDK
jgi:hypothetical protein